MAAACYASRMVGCLFVLVALLQGATAQTRHIVGDNTGWTIPNDGASFYSTWAASKTFRVGDILVFNFATGSHEVETVTKAGFDACSASNRLSPVITTAPATITLKEGEHYYFCSIGNHCTAGQKLAINVTGATSSSPPTTTATPPTTSIAPPRRMTPTPSTTATPPMVSAVPPPTPGGPPSNSAPASIVAGFSATFLIAAAAVLF